MLTHLRTFLLMSAALAPLAPASAEANPVGPTVTGGSATVLGQGTPSIVVRQQTDKAIINWQTFNIAPNETTQFLQPNSSSVLLNRVTGGLGPSQIYGTLTANGRIFIVNPDGILFGAGAIVDTAGFLGTTHDIKNSDFMAGNYRFTIPGRPDASIVNLGTVGLTSGNGFTLDFYGDKLITLTVGDAIAGTVKDVATGQPLDALVKNTGALKANGGRVELTAAAARKIVDAVINNTGLIEANTIGERNGTIILSAATAADKPAGTPTQKVKVSGTLSTAGNKLGEKGGKIQITGESIGVNAAHIDASGDAGGGKVLIGGDWSGGNPNTGLVSNPSAILEPYSIPTASNVVVDAATTIDVSAKTQGNGGKAIVWSDLSTLFGGTIWARGGTLSGDGGFVETSGRQNLTFNGLVDTGAVNGKNGTLLLDPHDTTIGNTGTFFILPSAIETALLSGNVVVTTGTTGTDGGDITVAQSVTWGSANSLTLSAFRNIIVNSGVVIANTGAGSLSLRADETGTGIGTVNFLGTGKVDFSGSTGLVSIFYNPSDNPVGSLVSPTSFNNPIDYSPFVITNNVIPNQLTAYMLVNTIFDLQNIQNNLSGNYALGKNIDASPAATWNSGAGFLPIGYSSASTFNNTVIPLFGVNATPGKFVGIFDGLGHTVSNLTINNTGAFNLGLFSSIGSAGVVRNVGLLNGSVTGGGADYMNFGLLTGWNFGTIRNVYATGSVSAGDGAVRIGGLVGWNWGGLIADSHASVTVSGGNGASEIGGLVGSGGLFLFGGGTIINSYATGNVTGGNSAGAIGGLIGDNNSAIIRNSYATGNVTGGTNSSGLGGLAGGNNGYWGGDLITASYATGTVIGGTGSSYVGGLVGVNLWTSIITDSYSTGNVTGGTGIGGLVGWNGYTAINQFVGSTIETSYATGLVSGITDVGGLVGHDNSGTVINSYWNTQTSGMSSALGVHTGSSTTFQATGLNTAQLKSGVPFGFDPSVWAINPSVNSGYPYLLWQTTSAPPLQITTIFSPDPPPQVGTLPTNFSPPTTTPPPSTGQLPTGFSPFGTGQTASLNSQNTNLGTTRSTDTRALFSAIPPSGDQPSLILVNGQTMISNTMQWTGKFGPTTAEDFATSMLTYSLMADGIYSGAAVNGVTPLDWTKIVASDYLNAFYSKIAGSGFQAGVYKSGNKIVLVFGGTDPLSIRDWGTDALNFFEQQTMQYSFASALTAGILSYANANHLNMVVTGHSLAGGMAAYAGAMNDVPAITFNPTDVPLDVYGKGNLNRVLNIKMQGGGVDFTGGLIGTTITVNQNTTNNNPFVAVPWNIFYWHEMGVMESALVSPSLAFGTDKANGITIQGKAVTN